MKYIRVQFLSLAEFEWSILKKACRDKVKMPEVLHKSFFSFIFLNFGNEWVWGKFYIEIYYQGNIINYDQCASWLINNYSESIFYIKNILHFYDCNYHGWIYMWKEREGGLKKW